MSEINLNGINQYSNSNNEVTSEVTMASFDNNDGGEVVTQEQQDLATKNRLRKYSKKKKKWCIKISPRSINRTYRLLTNRY